MIISRDQHDNISTIINPLQYSWLENSMDGRLQSMGSLRVEHDWETSLSFFTFIKRLFSSSSLSAIRVVSSAYLRLLIFLQAILTPACASSSPAFLMMYSAYKLNKQGDNIQPWHTPCPFWNLSVAPLEKNLNKSGYTYIYNLFSVQQNLTFIAL